MCEANGVGAALQPGTAVPGQHDLRVDGGQVVQGPPVEIDIGGGGWRHHPRSGASCVGIQGDQCVTAQEDVAVGQQE